MTLKIDKQATKINLYLFAQVCQSYKHNFKNKLKESLIENRAQDRF